MTPWLEIDAGADGGQVNLVRPGSAAPTPWECWRPAGTYWPASAAIPTARRLGLMPGRRR